MRLIFGLVLTACAVRASRSCGLPPAKPAATFATSAAAGASFSASILTVAASIIPLTLISHTVDLERQLHVIKHHDHALQAAGEKQELICKQGAICRNQVMEMVSEGRGRGDQQLEHQLNKMIDFQEQIALLQLRVQDANQASSKAFDEMDFDASECEEAKMMLVQSLPKKDALNSHSQLNMQLAKFLSKIDELKTVFADLPGDYFVLEDKVRMLKMGRHFMQDLITRYMQEGKQMQAVVDEKLEILHRSQLVDLDANKFRLLAEIGNHRAGVKFTQEQIAGLERDLLDLADLPKLEAKMEAIIAPIEANIQRLTDEAMAIIAPILPYLTVS